MEPQLLPIFCNCHLDIFLVFGFVSWELDRDFHGSAVCALLTVRCILLRQDYE